MSSIVAPIHYQIYECRGSKWFAFDPSGVFYNPTDTPMNLKYVEHQFCLTAQQVAIELFRNDGGKPGYYLANLRDRKYYYCGSNWEDIKTTLISLGIGRADPQSSVMHRTLMRGERLTPYQLPARTHNSNH